MRGVFPLNPEIPYFLAHRARSKNSARKSLKTEEATRISWRKSSDQNYTSSSEMIIVT
jgi:hypothetical protein